MPLNLSRHLQTYDFFWRFPIAEYPYFGPEQTLRYAELLLELRDLAAPEKRARLLLERALIEELAGRDAAAQRSLEEAIDLASRSAPSLETELRYQRAKLRFRASDFVGAQHDLEALADDEQTPPPLWSRARLILGRVALDQGRCADAIKSLEGGLAAENTSRNRFSGHLDLVYAHIHQSDRAAATAALEAAVRLVEPNNQLDEAALAYYRGWLDFTLGQWSAARSSLELARDKLHAQPSTDPLACCELTLGLMAYRGGHTAECLAQCDRVFALIGPRSRSYVLLSVRVLRGRTLMLQGRYAAAIEQFRRAREQAAARRRPVYECRALEGVAAVHALVGEFAPARQALEESLRLRRQAGDTLGECVALSDLGAVEHRAGCGERARVHFQTAQQIALRIGNVIEQGRAATGFAELAIGGGHFTEAAEALALAAGLYEGINSRTRLAVVRALQAEALSFQDHTAQAIQRIDEATALVAGDASPLFLAEILATRADVLDDSGDRDGALQALARAGELATQCGAEALVEQLRRTAEEVREREFARQLLGRYLDPRVVARLLARPERRVADSLSQTVAVLFSDVRGYTTLSEQLSPHEVVSLLNDHFGAMAEEVLRFGGFIDKFIGDAIMVVFGDPGHPRPDDAARAVQAAVAMVQRREAMNEQRARANLPPVKIGVGVHVGPVVMGHIGSRHQVSYTVIGDAVNVAARLESETKVRGCAILISEDVASSEGQRLPVEFKGDLSLKGRDAPVRAFTVRTDG